MAPERHFVPSFTISSPCLHPGSIVLVNSLVELFSSHYFDPHPVQQPSSGYADIGQLDYPSLAKRPAQEFLLLASQLSPAGALQQRRREPQPPSLGPLALEGMIASEIMGCKDDVEQRPYAESYICSLRPSGILYAQASTPVPSAC